MGFAGVALAVFLSMPIAGPCSEVRSESDFNEFYNSPSPDYLLVHRPEKPDSEKWVRCTNDIGGDFSSPPQFAALSTPEPAPPPREEPPPETPGVPRSGPITVAPPKPSPPPVAKSDPPPAPAPPVVPVPPQIPSKEDKPSVVGDGEAVPKPPSGTPSKADERANDRVASDRQTPQPSPNETLAQKPRPTPSRGSSLDDPFGEPIEHGDGKRADFSISAPNGMERIRTGAERGTGDTLPSIPTDTVSARGSQADLEEKWNTKAEGVLNSPSASADQIFSMLQDLVALDPDIQVPGLDTIVGAGASTGKTARGAKGTKRGGSKMPSVQPVVSNLGAFPGAPSEGSDGSPTRRAGGRMPGWGAAPLIPGSGAAEGPAEGAPAWNEDDIVVGNSAVHPKLVSGLLQAWEARQAEVGVTSESTEERSPASLPAGSSKVSLGGVSGSHWLADEGARGFLGLIGAGMLLAASGWWVTRRRAMVTSRSHHDSRHRPPR